MPEHGNERQRFISGEGLLPCQRRFRVRMQKIHGHMAHTHLFETEGKVHAVLPALTQAEQAAGTHAQARRAGSQHSVAPLLPGLRSAHAGVVALRGFHIMVKPGKPGPGQKGKIFSL